MGSRKAFRPKGTPKTGGRTKGTPNKVSTEVKTFCGRLIDDPDYQAGFAQRFKAGTLPAPLEAMVWHYRYGKPTEYIEHSGEVRMPAKVIFELHHP